MWWCAAWARPKAGGSADDEAGWKAVAGLPWTSDYTRWDGMVWDATHGPQRRRMSNGWFCASSFCCWPGARKTGSSCDDRTDEEERLGAVDSAEQDSIWPAPWARGSSLGGRMTVGPRRKPGRLCKRGGGLLGTPPAGPLTRRHCSALGHWSRRRTIRTPHTLVQLKLEAPS